jgi:hypothetical protein
MLAAAQRHEERLQREAAEQKIKDEIEAKMALEQEEKDRIRAEKKAKLEADIAAGIIPRPEKPAELDLDTLSKEEQILIFGDDSDQIDKYCNPKNQCRLGCCLFWFIGAAVMIGLSAGGVFDTFLTNPCWEPSREVSNAIKYYNTSAPLPNEPDSLVEEWIDDSHEPFVIPSDWCNGAEFFVDVNQDNISYLRLDTFYPYGRYYITHGPRAHDACYVTKTLTLDSMCSDPNKTVTTYTPSPSSEDITEGEEYTPAPGDVNGTGGSSSSSSTATKTKTKKPKKIRLKDPCWLTIQGDTQLNLDYWEWEKNEAILSKNKRRERTLKVSNKGKTKSTAAGSDPFVPTSLSTTCRSTEIIVTKRGRGGVPAPNCQERPITTVLDGGGVQQLFRITTGAKVSLRDLILRNSHAAGNCFCPPPHIDCGGGAIFVMDKKSHFLGNNLIFVNNKAWMGGAIFANLHATISLASVQIMNNLAKNNGTRLCQGGGYGGGLYLYNGTRLTAVCTNIIQNEAGDSGGGVTLQTDSTFVALGSSIINNTAKINTYYDRDDPTKKVKEFAVGKDMRMYDTTTFRAAQGSRLEDRDVYPYVDVSNSIYLELYYSEGSRVSTVIMCQLLFVAFVTLIVL